MPDEVAEFGALQIEAAGIGKRLPALQSRGFLDLLRDERAEAAARQRVVPGHEVGRRAEQGTAASRAPEHHGLPPVAPRLFVCQGEIRDVYAVREVRARCHAEW